MLVGDRADVRGLRLRSPRGVPWNSRNSVGATVEVELEVAVDGVDLDVVEQLDARDRDRVGEHLDHGVDGGVERRERARVAAVIASGVGCRRSVASVISPSVPSEPTNSRVRS